MSHRNAILDLRARALAASTRPFRARGSKIVRCEQCLLGVRDCICALRPEVAARSAFCFLMYEGEAYKPSNTGRLIADVIADHHAFQWARTTHDPALLTLLQHDDYAPILVFPHEYAETHRHIASPQDITDACAGKTPLFVVPDGTWREAKKIFKSSYLAGLPVLGLNPDSASRYLMRDAAWQFQWSTAETGIEVLRLAGDAAAAEALAQYFAVFCERYAGIRTQMVHKDRSTLAERFTPP